MNQNRSFNVVERPLVEADNPQAGYRIISEDYFHTMGIPLKQGREFSERDVDQSPPVAIVNEQFVHDYFVDENPIGKHITIGGKVAEVVGVAGNIKHSRLVNDAQPEFYFPYTQTPEASIAIVVRSTVEPTSLAPSVRNAIFSVDSNQPVADIQTMEQRIENSIADSRLLTTLLSCLSAIALILSIIGIYGVITYYTAQRTREIGIRMALGAKPGDVLRLILKQGMFMALIGVGIGILAAIAVTRVLSSMIYGVSATDPLIYGAIAALFVTTMLLGCYIPSRRAMRVDPMDVLRHE
jgi:putative ABC transport system permease protein